MKTRIGWSNPDDDRHNILIGDYEDWDQAYEVWLLLNPGYERDEEPVITGLYICRNYQEVMS